MAGSNDWIGRLARMRPDHIEVDAAPQRAATVRLINVQ
jgi:hypothetical protein